MQKLCGRLTYVVLEPSWQSARYDRVLVVPLSRAEVYWRNTVFVFAGVMAQCFRVGEAAGAAAAMAPAASTGSRVTTASDTHQHGLVRSCLVGKYFAHGSG